MTDVFGIIIYTGHRTSHNLRFILIFFDHLNSSYSHCFVCIHVHTCVSVSFCLHYIRTYTHLKNNCTDIYILHNTMQRDFPCHHGNKELDGVPRTQTSRLLLSYYSSRSHGTVVCTTTCKERNCCRPRDPASWPNMAATPDDCERTATVALPTAASGGSISGDLGTSAALDAFSTVY